MCNVAQFGGIARFIARRGLGISGDGYIPYEVKFVGSANFRVGILSGNKLVQYLAFVGNISLTRKRCNTWYWYVIIKLSKFKCYVWGDRYYKFLEKA